jgi:RHS repeat-associated protein
VQGTSQPGSVQTLKYDAAGFVVGRKNSAVSGTPTITDHNDLDGKLLQEEAMGPGTSPASYLLGDGPTDRIARVSTTANGTGDGWFIQDRLGNVTDVADLKTGQAGAKYAYDAFGNTTSSAGFTINNRTTDRAGFGFTGLRQGIGGTTQAHYRSYDSTSGQWMQEDPISFAAGDANVRRYVGNGPTNGVDPSGLDSAVPSQNNPGFWDSIGTLLWRSDPSTAANALQEAAGATADAAHRLHEKAVDKVIEAGDKAVKIHDAVTDFARDVLTGDSEALQKRFQNVWEGAHDTADFLNQLAHDPALQEQVADFLVRRYDEEVERFESDPSGYLMGRGLDLLEFAGGARLQEFLMGGGGAGAGKPKVPEGGGKVPRIPEKQPGVQAGPAKPEVAPIKPSKAPPAAVAPNSLPVKKGHTRVYRAVSEEEYKDILDCGKLRQGPNSLEGKWFADSLEGANAHGNGLFPGGKFRLVEVDIPDDAPSLFRLPNLDGRGPARYLHNDDLPGLSPRLLE